MNMEQGINHDEQEKRLSNALEVELPGEKRLREGIEKLDPMRFKVLEVLSDLLERENNSQILSDKDYTTYFKEIPKIISALDEILSLRIETEEDKDKMRALCEKKEKLVESLPTVFGIRKKVRELTFLDPFGE